MPPMLVLVAAGTLAVLAVKTVPTATADTSKSSTLPSLEVAGVTHSPEGFDQTSSTRSLSSDYISSLHEDMRTGSDILVTKATNEEQRTSKATRDPEDQALNVTEMHRQRPNTTPVAFKDSNSLNAAEGTNRDGVDEDLRDLNLIPVPRITRQSYASTTEVDVEGSGMDEDDQSTQASPTTPKKPNDNIPPFTGCTPSLCQDIVRANITAEPSFIKVPEGSPVSFTCKQTSDFNQTGRWFILRWQGPNGTLEPLHEKPDEQKGRASVLSGEALIDMSEMNYTCAPDVPTSCCDDVGVTVTLVVYEPPVYTTHMAVLGGLVLLFALVCLVLHETRRRMYQRVKTAEEVDDEWEYE